MGKSLKCGDLVPGCEFEAKGTEEEILQPGLLELRLSVRGVEGQGLFDGVHWGGW